MLLFKNRLHLSPQRRLLLQNRHECLAGMAPIDRRLGCEGGPPKNFNRMQNVMKFNDVFQICELMIDFGITHALYKLLVFEIQPNFQWPIERLNNDVIFDCHVVWMRSNYDADDGWLFSFWQKSDSFQIINSNYFQPNDDNCQTFELSMRNYIYNKLNTA